MHTLAVVRAVCGALLFAVTSVPALATTIALPESPGAMLEQADVVVVGTVESVVAERSDRPRTVTTIAVEKIKKGDAGATIQLRELGGITAAGQATVVVGAPKYRVGDRVLVLGTRRPDGSLQTHLMDVGRVELERPWLGLGALRAVPAQAPGSLGAWKTELAEKALALPDVEPAGPTPSPAPAAATGRVSMLPLVSSEALRTMGAKWRRSEPIPVHPPTIGDVALGLPASDAAILAGLGAWNGAGAGIRLEASTVRLPPAGFAPQPGKLIVSFDDPLNEIEDPQGCSGVLAIGGFSADGQTRADGLQTIVGSALVFNDGWGGCGFWSSGDIMNFSEVMAHEFGHNAGLAHSCDQGQSCDTEARAALMFWMASFGGRGATLGAHDIRSIRELYPVAAPTALPSPVPTRSPSPTATVAPTVVPPEPEPEPTRRPCGMPIAEAAILLGGVFVVSRRAG